MNRAGVNTKPFLIAWSICLVAMGLAGAWFVTTGISLDFRSFYVAGHQVRTHTAQLYDLAAQAQMQRTVNSKNDLLPFDHPAYESLVYLPFSMLKYRSAYFAFIAFNMFLVMASFFAAPTAFSAIIPLLQPRPGLMFFVFVPLLLAVTLGQDSILSLLIYCLTWRQLESDKDVSAGCVLALGLFKPQIVIPIAVLLAIKRGWRFSAGFLATSIVVALLCVSIVGSTGVTAWIRLLHYAATSINHTAFAHRKGMEHPSAMPNLAGLLYASGARFLQSSYAFNLLVGICSAGLFAWCARIIRRCDLNVAVSIAILCGLLVSYHLYFYDLTLSLLPVALLAGRAPRYITLILFSMPAILIPLGLSWFFLWALPLLAMLVYALLSAPQPKPLQPAIAHAAPA